MVELLKRYASMEFPSILLRSNTLRLARFSTGTAWWMPRAFTCGTWPERNRQAGCRGGCFIYRSQAQRGSLRTLPKGSEIRLGKFAHAFHVAVRQLAADDVRDNLAARNLSAQSRNNNRRVLQTFFGFCQSRGWLSREADLLDGVGKYKGATAPIEIFTPAELRALLHAAPPKLAGAIAVQAFGGIRAEEMLRLTWADLERRRGFIEIVAGKSKTSSRRLVQIPTNLAQWLLSAPRGGGDKVWPHTSRHTSTC